MKLIILGALASLIGSILLAFQIAYQDMMDQIVSQFDPTYRSHAPSLLDELRRKYVYKPLLYLLQGPENSTKELSLAYQSKFKVFTAKAALFFFLVGYLLQIIGIWLHA
jgi:hypothetical protein